MYKDRLRSIMFKLRRDLDESIPNHLLNEIVKDLFSSQAQRKKKSKRRAKKRAKNNFESELCDFDHQIITIVHRAESSIGTETLNDCIDNV